MWLAPWAVATQSLADRVTAVSGQRLTVVSADGIVVDCAKLEVNVGWTLIVVWPVIPAGTGTTRSINRLRSRSTIGKVPRPAMVWWKSSVGSGSWKPGSRSPRSKYAARAARGAESASALSRPAAVDGVVPSLPSMTAASGGLVGDERPTSPHSAPTLLVMLAAGKVLMAWPDRSANTHGVSLVASAVGGWPVTRKTARQREDPVAEGAVALVAGLGAVPKTTENDAPSIRAGQSRKSGNRLSEGASPPWSVSRRGVHRTETRRSPLAILPFGMAVHKRCWARIGCLLVPRRRPRSRRPTRRRW